MAPLKYSNACAQLPANRPLGFPHLIDARGFSEETDKQNLRAVDAIVTLLYNWKPEAMRAVLDLNRGKFEYSHKEPNFNTLVVARMGQHLMFGYLESGGAWESQLNYKLSVAGKWVPQYGVMNDYHTDSPEVLEEFGLEFAKSILYWKKWQEKKGVTMNVEWTKLPGEDGYKEWYQSEQYFYGLPE